MEQVKEVEEVEELPEILETGSRRQDPVGVHDKTLDNIGKQIEPPYGASNPHVDKVGQSLLYDERDKKLLQQQKLQSQLGKTIRGGRRTKKRRNMRRKSKRRKSKRRKSKRKKSRRRHRRTKK